MVAVSPHHKNHDQLHAELEKAKLEVRLHGTYSHYKHPENTYTVIGFAFRESTDELCVIYKAEYDNELVFVRELSSWLEMPEVQGKKVARFRLIESK